MTISIFISFRINFPETSLGKGSAPVECPKTKVIDKVTLKGGVDAGDFHDNGEVDDMDKCRRICCEMTQCHLAFMLGKNCFSVKCHDVDSCRAQKAKPSSFYPRVTIYISTFNFENEFYLFPLNLEALTRAEDKHA